MNVASGFCHPRGVRGPEHSRPRGRLRVRAFREQRARRCAVRCGAVVATASITWWGGAAAAAATARGTHQVRVTVVENQISTTNPNPAGPPPVGTVTVRAGVAVQKPGGRGADVDRVTITSLSLSTRSATFTGRVRFFLLHGTLSGRSVGRVTIHADGSLTFSGTTTYTGGTGAYRGVTGHLTFTGASPNKPGAVTTIHLVGTATY